MTRRVSGGAGQWLRLQLKQTQGAPAVGMHLACQPGLPASRVLPASPSHMCLLPPLTCLLSYLFAAAGKGKLAAEGEEGGEGGEQPCLEVLLGMPARPVSRRNESHLNQSLEVRGPGWACGG